MVKLSIASGGSFYSQHHRQILESNVTEELVDVEEERETLPGLVMLPPEPKISYKEYSIPYISLDYLPAEESSVYF